MKSHTPVLLHEVLELLSPITGEIFLDGTLGLGGHARAILERVGNKGKLIALDLDERNLKLTRENLKEFRSLEAHQANFRDLLDFTEPNSLDGVLLDIGVSSLHFDDASRGFSYQNDGDLDMRFDSTQELNAAEILNDRSENELAEIFFEFGEIRTAKKIARRIIEARKQKKLQRTSDLAEIIEAKSLLPQVFQALRITVNDELEALREGLNAALEALKSGGRIAVISFHSLEDRIVKNFFREQKKLGVLEVLTKKPVRSGAVEIAANPRSRSAKLRGARKF